MTPQTSSVVHTHGNGTPIVPLLTMQRRRVLNVIRDFYEENKFAPTVREIAAVTGLSVSAVQNQLVQLERMGWIKRHPGRSRALIILDPATGKP